MVKKLKTGSEQSDDEQLAEAVRASAQQIWQAGLGAFAKAQKEGGKIFATLVKEGNELQERTQEIAGNVTTQASGSWDKLEQVFEDRVARSLKSLGVPTQDDIEALSRRIDELSKAVATLSTGSAGKAQAKKAASKSPVKKAASKTATKKTARKSAG